MSHSHSFTPYFQVMPGGYHNHTVSLSPNQTTGSSGSHFHSLDIPSFNSSASGAYETRPKNITVMYCIKY